MRQPVVVLSTVLLSIAVLSVSRPGSGAEPAPPPWPTHGWRQGTAASVGLDEHVLEKLDLDLAQGKYSLVDSVQVFRCGTQVFSRTYIHDYGKIYGKQAKTRGPLNARLTGPYNYYDPAWHPYYRGTDLHTMQSVSKTVTSVIIGIARTREVSSLV